MQVSIDDAAQNFRALIEAVRNGEDVVITEDGAPVVRMEVGTRSGFRFGILADVLRGEIPDFSEPMDPADLALWEARGDETC